MAVAVGLARRWMSKGSMQPLHFPDANFEMIPASQKLEEEAHDPLLERYYPLRIGEILNTKYQVVGKLGFGLGSTVWLANDLYERRAVALKIFTNDIQNREEISIYKHLQSIKSNHPGRRRLRDALGTFTLHGTKGEHQCLVHEPMWESARDLLWRNASHKFTEDLLKAFLYRLLQAIDYLHSEAHLIHTDISASNILLEIEDHSIISAFIEAEQNHPSPRKQIDRYTVYASRSFDLPKSIGQPVLSDFGSAVHGDVAHGEDVQPDVYRSPEVCLQIPWSYSIDIWNVGVLIWDLFEGKHMFYGKDPKEKRYMTRAHISEMIAIMGPPPLEFLKRGKRTAEFFTEDGQWRGEIPLPTATSLEESEERLTGDSKEAFLHFMRKMLQWEPERRQTAKQLLQDPWLNGNLPK
ncbi:kinase domain protein [Phaeosphaeriaceae sp. PMI808]|nr:kinase domain protein [Phaeosphaeriaceae sp. PMI808]